MKILITTVIILYLKITTSYFTNFSTASTSNIPRQSTVSSFKHCGNITCFNNAMCKIRSNGEPICMCRVGFMGYTCGEDLDECRLRYPCSHRGICQNYFGSYRCVCLKGWLDEHNHCSIKDNSTTVRECTKGWFGEWCMDQCFNDSMCRYNENCVKRHTGIISNSGHICRCAPGWHGRYCSIDIDECLRHPCPKNTTCINNPGSFSCPCLLGWEGTKCNKDVDECVANPCQHSSNCTNTPGSYNCTCAEGWKGHTCEEDIDECVMNNPCNASTNCENVPGSFKCTDTVSKEESASGNVYVIVGAVVGTVLLIGCIAIGLYVIKRKSRKVNASVDSQLEDLTDNHHKQSKNASSNEDK